MKKEWHILRMLSLIFSFASLLLSGSNSVWAVYPPEPQSGGKYFSAKGTRSTEEYRYLGRTGVRRPDDFGERKGIQSGALNVKPYASYTGEYDSNVFLEDDDADGDYISRLNWGVDGELPMEDRKYVLSGGVHSESEWFAKSGEENHTDWIYQGAAEMNFTHFSVDLFEEFRRTVNRAGNELTSRQDRYENYLSGLITIPFAEFFQETEISHYNLEFRDNASGVFDRQELRVVPRIGMNVGDRTQALIEYDWTHINYDEVDDRNGMAHQLAAGVRGFLGDGDLVSYQAWAGWQFRNYNSDLREDFSGFIFRTNVEYRRSEVSRFFFEANRQPVESVTTTNSFIVRNQIAAGWRRRLTERLSGEIRSAVGFYDYSNDRFDFYWEPGGKIDYLVTQYTHLFAEYRFTGRNSDASNQDYARHLANVGLRIEV